MTNDSLPVLERIFRRQCTSLAQYLAECFVWTHRGDRAAEELVRSIIADERRWAQRLADLIEERGGVPLPGNYPDEFVTHNWHFLALDYMLQRLAEYIERELARMQAELPAAPDDPPVRTLLEQMAERKRGQVQALRRLGAAATSAPAGRSV